MVIVSGQDEVVPPAMGREIFQVLQASGDAEEGVDCWETGRQLVVIEGARHGDVYRYPDWAKAMKQYFETPERPPGLDEKFG
jgi:hypothetical protein